MQDELKEQWIKALRSGEYSQGHGMLRDADNDYCCLGVLLDLCETGEWDGPQPQGTYVYRVEYDDYVIQDELDLSIEVLNILGLDNQEQTHLVEMNDDDGADFDEIANWIEENV